MLGECKTMGRAQAREMITWQSGYKVYFSVKSQHSQKIMWPLFREWGEGLQSIAFTKINWLKAPHSQNKGHTIFYKHCNLTKKYNYRAAIWYGAEEGSHSFSLSSLEIFQEICTKKMEDEKWNRRFGLANVGEMTSSIWLLLMQVYHHNLSYKNRYSILLVWYHIWYESVVCFPEVSS